MTGSYGVKINLVSIKNKKVNLDLHICMQNIQSKRGTTSEYGDTTNEYGDATSEYGDTTSEYGDTASEYWDTTSEYGDTTSEYGKNKIIPSSKKFVCNMSKLNLATLETKISELCGIDSGWG